MNDPVSAPSTTSAGGISGSDQPKSGMDLKTATARSRALAASLGAVVAVMMRSPEHRNTTLAEIEALIGPPLVLDQVAIIEARDGESGIVAPVAAVLWATVSPEIDARLSNVVDAKQLLQARDWRSGPIPWIISAIGHKTAVTQLLEQLVKSQFADTPPKIRIREADGTVKIGVVRTGTPEAAERE